MDHSQLKQKRRLNRHRYLYTNIASFFSFDTIFECLLKQSPHILDLWNCTCTCNKWYLFEILCMHAISTLLFMQQSIADYITSLNIAQALQVIYTITIRLISSIEYWTKSSNNKIDVASILPSSIQCLHCHLKNHYICMEDMKRVKRMFRSNQCKNIGDNCLTC